MAIPPKKFFTTDINEAMAMTDALSRMPRSEILRSIFYAYPNFIPSSGYDGQFVTSSAFSFAPKELQGIINHADFIRYAESVCPDIEQADGEEFFNWLLEHHGDETMYLRRMNEMLEDYMDAKYPPPNTDVFASFKWETMEQKDYYLPAFKVLNEDENGMLWSPAFATPWKNDRLDATHMSHANKWNAHASLWPTLHEGQSAEAAMSECFCGIYASVNLDELDNYMWIEHDNHLGWGMDERFNSSRRRLCIIEPEELASVFTARKGWKASSAFVSEIVDRTMSMEEASRLVSMVWNRPLDISKLFRGRSKQNENR